MLFLELDFAEQGVAFFFENAADYRGGVKRGRLGDLFGADVNLTPTQLFEKGNGCSVNNEGHAGPDDSALTHRTRFSGGVESEALPV